MSNKAIFRIVAMICITLVLIIVGAQYTHIQKSKIEAPKAIKVEQVRQAEKTERTEERSQFWQKLVSWGKDEVDEGKADANLP